jgi:hypothetical protein
MEVEEEIQVAATADLLDPVQLMGSERDAHDPRIFSAR